MLFQGEKGFNPFRVSASPRVTLQAFLDEVLDEALRLTRSDVGGTVALLSRDPPSFRFRRGDGTLRVPQPDLRQRWCEGGRAALGREAASDLLYVEDASRPTAGSPMFNECGSLLRVPLAGYEPGLGVLQVEASAKRAFSAAQRDALARLARAAGLVVSRIQLRDHAEQQGLRLYFVGQSPRLLELEEVLKRVASDPKSPVLVTGERGSGKELAAYAIHYFSQRRDQAFVPVNCAALSDTLFADELFGHECHAFTGAQTPREGLFQAAHQGTLFFDEIADMSPAIQANLLRVLDQGELQRIGRDRAVKVDVRVVCATNKDLERMVREGDFRADLYDRLNVLRVSIPPLRDRKEDIALLAGYFLKQSCLGIGRYRRPSAMSLCTGCLEAAGAACATSELARRLADYEYPGNVRELRNLIARLAAMEREGEMKAEHVAPYLEKSSERPSQAGSDLRLESVVREHILRVLDLARLNKSQAARMLDLPLTTLINKMKRLGI